MRKKSRERLYVIGWVVGKHEACRGFEEGDNCFAGEYGESVSGVSLDQAKRLRDVLKGSKIYRLVEMI
jgi:hypothetical protein